MNVKDVAQFMLNELKKKGVLNQVGLVDIIKEKFGDEFVFETTHGTLTIDRKVIREFNKVKGENILWDKDGCCWR
ncbi:DUF6953 family protein [Sulfurospirillum arcachonense]|uniref:DUF6953 family protein n=1 Tax=Sulfurospirillum arcachonense TaxID=57666 RepID=UPI000469B0AC|nr:hypothetical protein [Sulfurospirillum arcachonense]